MPVTKHHEPTKAKTDSPTEKAKSSGEATPDEQINPVWQSLATQVSGHPVLGASGEPPPIQRKPIESTQDDDYEIEADQVAERVMRMPLSESPVSLVREAAAPSNATEITARTLIVEDTVGELRAGQVRKSDFLARVRASVCEAIEPILAGAGRTSSDCPYLNLVFNFLERRDADHIEHTLRGFAPDLRDVSSADAYIPIVVERASQSTRHWVRTGEITGLPEGIPGTFLRSAVSDERTTTSAASAVQPKAKPGGVRLDHNPTAILSQLGPGRSLDSGVASRMGSAFGTDFSHVRMHNDAESANLSTNLNARAFTVGQHVAFGPGEYCPGTPIGDALIAHELAHVVQQRGVSELTPAQTKGGDQGDDVLEDAADRSAMGAIVSLWSRGKIALTDVVHNTLPRFRSGLRLQRCMPSTAPRDRRSIEQVRADLEASGELGPRTDPRTLPPDYAAPELPGPTPLSVRDQAAVSANPPTLTVAEMALDLGVIEAQLERLEPLLRGRPGGVSAIRTARAQVTAIQGRIGTTDATVQSRRILRTRVVLEQSRRALTNLQVAGQSLSQPGVLHATQYAREFTRVTGLFDLAVGRSLEDDVLERFQQADQAAARLPRALIEADLDAFGSLSAGAQRLQPSIRDIHAWAARLRPRLTALEEQARPLAQARTSRAANLQTLEAQFRDQSDSLTLSIEALAYWEQLARSYAYMAGHPPYDIRAFDGIARLMPRVRQMRDADERGDVALLEVLVRRYREDEDVQRFLRNIHVFVGFSRTALSMGIVLAAALASAGVGAAATAAIGTTTTTAGTVTAFVGVTALEALTFTAVSRGLQSTLPGQQAHGSFWSDLAWNFGLFTVLKLANLGAARATQSVGIPAFTRLVQHTTSFPLLLGYGAVRFRFEKGEWPTSDQFNQMAAETLIMIAGFAIGTARFRSRTASQPRELKLFRERYGLQFETLDAGRQALVDQTMRAARDPATPDTASADVGRRARILEGELRTLIENIRADRDIRLPALRDALRSFGSHTEAFALQIRLMEAGLTAPNIAAIEARIEALPELLRNPVRTQLGDVAEYATRVVSNLAARRAALETMGRVGTNPRIDGFGNWVRFSTAQGPGTSPAEQARNFLDDVGELHVAESMSLSVRAGERVEVGGDARRRTRPGTSEFLPSFDIMVTGGEAPRNVEVYSPQRDRPVVGDFGEAINHAADKNISDASLPADYQTTGRVEAAVRINWPPPEASTRAGTFETASNGDIALVTGDGRRISRGNFFEDYVGNLNNPRRSPAGARRVDVFTVYDRTGNALYRYTRNPTTNTWSGTPL